MTADTVQPKHYIIRHLRDIYDLPTDEMVERCCRELSALMLIMRRTAALMEACADAEAKEKGEEPLPAVKWTWPDETVWTDDNGGESKIHFKVLGSEILTVAVRHKRHRKPRKKERP